MTDRGVSDVVGFALVFGLVVSVVAIVSVAGMDSLQSTRDAEQVNNAERAMEVLAENMDDIHERGAPSRATEISLEEAQVYLDDAITIEVTDAGGGGTIVDYDIRPLVYRGNSDTELVYVNGAVLRDQPEGGVVIREWTPVANGDRVLVPVINTTQGGDTASIQSSTVLVRANERERSVPFADREVSGTLEVTVETDRTALWYRMLEEQRVFDSCTESAGSVTCAVPDADRLYLSYTWINVALQP